jgi:K+-sensing histidine kinase KdpD
MTDESTQVIRRINKNRAGIVVGSLTGLWHLIWSLLVAFGVAQAVINWVFRLHFIQPPYTITAFNVVTAVTLIVVTSVIGFVVGWLFGAIWNWLHSSE